MREPTIGHPSIGMRILLGLAVAFLLLLAVELILMLAGVRPLLYEEDPFVGFSSRIPLFVETTDAQGVTSLVTAHNKLSWFNAQSFPRVKPANTFRVFCLGGSTTYGRPYDDATSFAGWLREYLPVADPSRRWEVINAGGISYASYRVALVMEELIRYEPDLFIVYSGQNEFLERRTYAKAFETPEAVRGFSALLTRTRVYTALSRLAGGSSQKPAESGDGPDPLPAEVETILADSVGPQAYTRDDELKENVLAHYRFNLDRMVDIARSAGARVIFVVPGSNLADCSPFKSEHGATLSAEEITDVEELAARARAAFEAGRTTEALTRVDETLRVDERYAHLHYLRGQLLLDLGRYDEARAAFQRALDEDVCPLRALSPMRDMVMEVAGSRQAPVVDFAALIEADSPHGIAGEEFFLDHVHPTIEGNRRLALALLATMAEEGFVEPTPDWNQSARDEVTQKVLGRVDRRAHGAALRNLAKVLNWAGKTAEAEKLARQALRAVPDDPEALDAQGAILEREGRLEEAVRSFERAISLSPDFVRARINASAALTKLGRHDDAKAHLEHVLRLEPDNARALNNLGIVQVEMGDLAEAVRSYRRAIDLRPQDAKTHNNLGNAYALQADFTRAETAFGEALAIQPEYAEAHYGLGLVMAHQRKFADAREHFGRAIDARPEYAEAHFSLGLTCAQMGSLEEAARHLERALVLRPDYEEARVNLDRVHSLLPSRRANE